MSAKPSAALLAACSLALGLAACGGDDDASSSSTTAGGGAPRTVAITIDAQTCTPRTLSLPAGPTTFAITNAAGSDLNEWEVMDGDTVLGEQEQIPPGETKSFTLTLKPGTYDTKCLTEATTQTEQDVVTVTGRAAAATVSKAGAQAVARYRAYLEQQTRLLVARSDRFVDAILAGDLTAARDAYAPARVPYERIEPVAESFGDLDPRIDIRANDVAQGDEFTGFHRLERAIFRERSLRGMAPIARQLRTDIAELARLVQTVKLQPEQIANGANELLGEVSRSKITGEEERYSKIDLVDFEANVEGARAAFDAVRPIVAADDAALTAQIEERFGGVMTGLEPHRRGTGFVPYTALTTKDTQALSRAIDALAEPLSQIAAKVA